MTHSTENDARCVLCGKPREDWPCGASWDGEHRPLAPETTPIPPGEEKES